jgi:hypothetical protein
MGPELESVRLDALWSLDADESLLSFLVPDVCQLEIKMAQISGPRYPCVTEGRTGSLV